MDEARSISTWASAPRGAAWRAHGAVRIRALAARIAQAWAIERDLRRPFLWAPVIAGAGSIVNLQADRDPPLWAGLVALSAFVAVAWLVRTRPVAFAVATMLAAFVLGHVATTLRIERVAAPVLPKFAIGNLTGFVEQIDLRREGARIVLRVTSIEGMAPETWPHRVRLTTRRDPGVQAGAHVALKARLLPPARAALPGGYDFARDAYFAGIGGVGNVLGRIERREPTAIPPFAVRVSAAIDRMRNALVERIQARLPGDVGAIAAAMVAGKRDLLSDDAKELIRQAGIFHIITIAGVQMTLVAGIFFVGMRRLLALSPTLALNYPIKKWAAACAIVGAIGYDVLTGSRVGTERALVMTSVLLVAVIVDRPSLSMRNLALAVMFVIAVEPEALLGASFQLSFAAVAALVAVWEARMARMRREADPMIAPAPPSRWPRLHAAREALRDLGRGHFGSMLVASFCATAATASFMAYNFHEFSPYVLIGNPLTLAMIEFFAVPAALIGTLAYPFGLDGPVWSWLGLGIQLVLGVARWIAAAPGATIHLPAFSPPAIAFLAFAVLSTVIWRTALLRATAIPFALIGLSFAADGPRFDLAVAATGDAAAVRGRDGALVLLGKRGGMGFTAEQWLRADADGRVAPEMEPASCDAVGCATHAADGRAVALVTDPSAFAEDCERAFVVVTPLYAPSGCGAAVVIDRRSLGLTGAVTLDLRGGDIVQRNARSPDEDRPWSRAPRGGGRGQITRRLDERATRRDEERSLAEPLD